MSFACSKSFKALRCHKNAPTLQYYVRHESVIKYYPVRHAGRRDSKHDNNERRKPFIFKRAGFGLGKDLTGEAFLPWLIDHLSRRARDSDDTGFRDYLRRVRSSYLGPDLAHKLKKIEMSKPSSTHDYASTFGDHHSLYESLLRAFATGGQSAVDYQLRFSYHGLVASKSVSADTFAGQKVLTDLRYPAEWYPATRYMQRVIHLHVGPTNSGKTYHALRRLEQAQSGIYAGPLRLLAHEVYSRFNGKGISCDLITGDEMISSEPDRVSRLQSCTVEMIPLNRAVEVAVVDEIQMMDDDMRGWAWTQALLGLKAQELHLCGEERTVPLIRELVANMGDRLEIHKYERLSPLKVMSNSLNGSLHNLRKGDCVVVFSRLGIHTMKKNIEKATKKRVAIVYGSLPPEIRTQQAKLFNDPDNDYDILVASDAIGMGLNLAIKRIIFESVQKFNGLQHEILKVPQIKQIGGRAGRFRTATHAGHADPVHAIQHSEADNMGLVTTLEKGDLPIVRKAMHSEAEPIMRAGIFPPTSVIERFAAYFPPSTSFSYMLLRLRELAVVHRRYKLCYYGDQTTIADTIQSVKNLSVRQRIIFCAAPCSSRDIPLRRVMLALAKCIGEGLSGALPDIHQIDIQILDEEMSTENNYLERLELLHRSLILYLWLSYRFSGQLVSQSMAFYVKSLVEERIEKMLSQFSSSRAIQRKIQLMREKAIKRVQRMRSKQPVEASGTDDDTQSELNDLPRPPSPEEQKDQGVGILQHTSNVESQMVRSGMN